jgi:arsenate reductase-like glutaredoxin family protein
MIQIIGTKKCKETAKAIRACKERGISYQLVDLNERELANGEWNNIFQHYDADDLIDKNSKIYKKKGYTYMEFDSQEELIENPLMMKTPILREKGKVYAGFDLKVIEEWGNK